MRTIIRKPGMNNMNHLFDNFFRDEPLQWSQQLNSFTHKPAVNISESESAFYLDLLVPGFTKEQINIEVENGLITLSAELENHNKEEDNIKFHRHEFNKKSFKRSFQFKEQEVDEEKIEASFSNGILHLELPKRAKEDVTTRRKIEIA